MFRRIEYVPPRIERNDEAMYLRFSDRPIKGTGTIAWPFVGDYGDDGDIIGLEIICDEKRRALSETSLMAFAIFSAALESLRANYNDLLIREASVAIAVQSRATQLSSTVGLDLEVFTEFPLQGPDNIADLVILDSDGSVLLLAEIKKRSFLKNDATRSEQVKHSLARLNLMMRLVDSHTIGVCAFIDEFGEWHKEGAVEPGSWIDWPETTVEGADGHLWTHVAIIPPLEGRPDWLPNHFQHTVRLRDSKSC